MADHFPVPDRYTNGVNQCTKMLNTSAGNRLHIRICLAMHSWAFISALIFSHVHNIHSAKCQDHTMTSLHLLRGIYDQGMAGGKDKAVCLPPKQWGKFHLSWNWCATSRHASSVDEVSHTPALYSWKMAWQTSCTNSEVLWRGLKTLIPGLDNSRHWSESGTRSPRWDQVPRKLSALKMPKQASSQFQVSDPPPSFSSWGSLLLLFCFL